MLLRIFPTTTAAVARPSRRAPSCHLCKRHAHLSSTLLPSVMNGGSTTPIPSPPSPPPSSLISSSMYSTTAPTPATASTLTDPSGVLIASQGSDRNTLSNPTWSDPAYLARYRDPAAHEKPLTRLCQSSPSHSSSSSLSLSGGGSGVGGQNTTSYSSNLSTSTSPHFGSSSFGTTATATSPTSSGSPSALNHSSSPSSSSFSSVQAPSSSLSSSLSSSSSSISQPTVKLATREEYRKREKARETPRSRRLEMERLWSGGEASPPIPLTDYRRKEGGFDRPKHALLFPGSGSQYVGMGHFLKNYSATEKVWDEAEEALNSFEEWRKGLGLEHMEGDVGKLGEIMIEKESFRRSYPKLKQVVFEGPQNELTRSSNAQPAILITSIAFLRTLETHFTSDVRTQASYFLGHSSGEYSAAVASGAISFADGVRLTRLHGLLTSYALTLPTIGLSTAAETDALHRAQMSALVINPGHSHGEVAEVVESINGARTSRKGQEGTVEVASYNSSQQVVLAGSRDGILRASEELRERGIASRAADLPVSAPFHCSFMKPAADGMRIALEKGISSISKPTAPLLSGLDGSEITTARSLVENLVAQISLPVKWSECLEILRRQRVERLIFLGPGKALANLARRDAGLLHSHHSNKIGKGGEEEEEVVQEGRPAEVLSVATEDDMGRLKEVLRSNSNPLASPSLSPL